jgi:phosphate transport system substrate-binding protein
MIKRTLFLIFFIFLGLTNKVFSQEELKVGAGASGTENILKPIKPHFEKATGIKLQILDYGPKQAMLELEKGAIDVACPGMFFEELLDLMKKEDVPIKDPASLNIVEIGKNRIVVLIHKDNPVNELSKDQLKGIFTGKITNWKEVGGKDMPIIVVWGKLTPGMNKMFVEKILDGEPVLKEVLEVTTAAEIKNIVAITPEAIGIGPLAVVDGPVKTPKTPEVSHPILSVTKGKPSAKVQKLIDFIKGEGQKYIKK